MDVRRGFHLEITISIIQYIRQYRNGGVTPAEQNEDWINIMNNHSKEQIALGNSRDKYDKINEYLKDLVSYADGLKNQAVLQ